MLNIDALDPANAEGVIGQVRPFGQFRHRDWVEATLPVREIADVMSIDVPNWRMLTRDTRRLEEFANQMVERDSNVCRFGSRIKDIALAISGGDEAALSAEPPILITESARAQFVDGEAPPGGTWTLEGNGRMAGWAYARAIGAAPDVELDVIVGFNS